MKNFLIPKWKTGHCLPHCIVAAADYLAGQPFSQRLEEQISKYGISQTKWLWPASAAIILGDAGFHVTVFENDIGYRQYADYGLNWIREKYGDIGEQHLRRHFDVARTIEDTNRALEHTRVEIIERNVGFGELCDYSKDDNLVFALNANYSDLHQKEFKRLGHYFLVRGVRDKKLIVADPLHLNKDIQIQENIFIASQKGLDEEVQHLLISL